MNRLDYGSAPVNCSYLWLRLSNEGVYKVCHLAIFFFSIFFVLLYTIKLVIWTRGGKDIFVQNKIFFKTSVPQPNGPVRPTHPKKEEPLQKFWKRSHSWNESSVRYGQLAICCSQKKFNLVKVLLKKMFKIIATWHQKSDYKFFNQK